MNLLETGVNNLTELREIYPYNPQTRTFTIPAQVGRFDLFFNPIDPSPTPTRDLSVELVEYLNQCSDEISNQYALGILLQVQHEQQNAQREQECMSSLRTFYQHAIFVAQAQMRHKRRQALRYLLVSLSCLAIYLISEKWRQPLFFWSLLDEALLIGGWVFMWEAVTLNFIEMDHYYQEIKKHQRLIKAKVDFRYGQNTTP